MSVVSNQEMSNQPTEAGADRPAAGPASGTEAPTWGTAAPTWGTAAPTWETERAQRPVWGATDSGRGGWKKSVGALAVAAVVVGGGVLAVDAANAGSDTVPGPGSGFGGGQRPGQGGLGPGGSGGQGGFGPGGQGQLPNGAGQGQVPNGAGQGQDPNGQGQLQNQAPAGSGSTADA